MTGKGVVLVLLGGLVAGGLWLRATAIEQAGADRRFYAGAGGALGSVAALERVVRMRGERSGLQRPLAACQAQVMAWPPQRGHAYQTRTLAESYLAAVALYRAGGSYLEAERAYGALYGHLLRVQVRLAVPPLPGTLVRGR